ncbi:MAG: hypothetical protein IT376_01875 [Polyangiaceae bacterium]|nr:hypothetical protein [Polyangiaceae bacterium]
MRHSIATLGLLLVALLACKKSDPTPAPVPESPTPPAAATPPPPPAAEEIEKFAGAYTTNWGKANCTQVKKNVNCLYAGKSGSLDCKVVDKMELDCDWSETGTSGKAKLTKQADGKLKGSWGRGESATNGGPWIFTPTS